MTSLALWAEWSDLFRDPEAQLSIPWNELSISTDAPFLDVGAGTGRETIQIAIDLPQHEVVAIEPSPSMRIALMARLSDRRDLHKRVTVLPLSLADVPTHYRFSGALLQNVIFSLPDVRGSLSKLTQMLLPNAPVLVNHIHKGGTGMGHERSLISSAILGRLRYERWFERRADGKECMRSTNCYVLMDGSNVIYSESETTETVNMDDSEIPGIAEAAGLVVDGANAPEYWILRAPGTSTTLSEGTM